MDNEKKQKHESYGMLQFNRVGNNKGKHLFGSSIPHSNTIKLSIHQGIQERRHSDDVYFAEHRPIIEVEMSYSQFTEAIMSFNNGSGTPVTITKLGNKTMADCPFDDKRKQLSQEFKNTVDGAYQDTQKAIQEAEVILKQKQPPKKAQKDKLLSLLHRIKQDIGVNSKFVYESFEKQTDQSVKEAKGELEAFRATLVDKMVTKAMRKEIESGNLKLPRLSD